MPKTKETRAPPKGEKPRKAPKLSEPKRKADFKSEETVIESGSESSRSGSSSGHSSGSKSDAVQRANTKKPNLQKLKVTEPANPRVPDVSSEEEEESEKEDRKAKSPGGVGRPKPNGTLNGKPNEKSNTRESSSEEDEEESGESEQDSEEDEDDSKANQKATPKPNGKQAEVKPGLEDDDSPPEDEASKVKGKALSEKTTTSGDAAGPPPPFAPPSGFKTVDLRHSDVLVKPSIISSKQIWHITAPAGVPISEITSISLANLSSSQSLLTHKDADYGLAEERHDDEPQPNKRLLLPSTDGKGYVAIDAPVTKTVHLQQIVELPHLTNKQANPATGSNAAAEAHQKQVRHAKPQPKGLRMRFKPPGFGDVSPGMIGSGSEAENEDVEMEDVGSSAGFKMPNGVNGSASSSKKRAAESADAAETPKQKKRKRKNKDSAIAETAAEATTVSSSDIRTLADIAAATGQEEPVQRALSKKAQKEADRAEHALVEGTRAELPMAKEEKARRKEEKRKKKERKKGEADASE